MAEEGKPTENQADPVPELVEEHVEPKLLDSITKLDHAIHNLIALFTKAIGELESNTDEVLSKKLDVLIGQNDEINHKLDRILGPKAEDEKLRLSTIQSAQEISRLKLKRKI